MEISFILILTEYIYIYIIFCSHILSMSVSINNYKYSICHNTFMLPSDVSYRFL